MESEDRTDEDVPSQDRPKSNDDGEAEGSLQADDPKIGEGSGEGERGLGVQSGASGGEHPTEPEDATPERGQTAGN